MKSIDRTQRPEPHTDLQWSFPDIVHFTLPQGLRVWLLERKALPVVSATLVLRSGALLDPPEKWGSSSMTGEGLDRGTGAKDALTISEELEYLGSSLRTRVGHDGTLISLHSLSRNIVPSLCVMADVVSQASFPDDEVERLRKQRLTSITQQKDRPGSAAGMAFQRLIYGGWHPYGTDPGGSEATVASLLRQDLVALHRRWYQPWNGTLIMIGPLSGVAAERMLADAFSVWRASTPATSQSPEISAAEPPGVYLIDRPGAAQSEIRIGKPSLPRNSSDFFPVIVMNRMLGGQFTSRLNATLREKRGFTYGAWSSFGFGKLGGPFTAGAAVHTESTGEAVLEFQRVLDQVHGGGLTADEVRSSIEGIAGGFALAFETPGQVASVIQNIILYDLPDDYYAHYLDNLREVSDTAVQSVASKYLDTRSMATVVVGDAKKVLPQLDALHLDPVTLTTLGALGL
jgi:predicted Zn-dependent peptidase